MNVDVKYYYSGKQLLGQSAGGYLHNIYTAVGEYEKPLEWIEETQIRYDAWRALGATDKEARLAAREYIGGCLRRHNEDTKAAAEIDFKALRERAAAI